MRWIMPGSVALLLVASACGDDSGGDDGEVGGSGGSGSGTPCTLGTSYDCFGRGGCEGRQICQQSGFLGSCVCPDQPPTPTRDASMMADGGPVTPGAGAGGNVPPPMDAAAADGQVTDGGPPTEEDCENDEDDDGDGDPDCADSDCTMRTCVETAPDGWLGPAVLFVGDANPPACGSGYSQEVARGGTAVEAAATQCSTCTCSPAAPGCAGFLNFGTGVDSACDGVGDCTTSLSNACAELTSPCFSGVATGYVQTQLPGGPTTCTASGQTPTLPAAGWAQNVLACAPADALARAGCDANQVCAHEAPFSGALCVVKTGDLACPAGAYSDRRVYFSAIADSRGCSACQCSHDCSYAWRIFDDADTTCQNPLLTLSSANQCVAVTPVAGKIRVGATITGSGACAASGGTPTGAAQATGPITVCCAPD